MLLEFITFESHLLGEAGFGALGLPASWGLAGPPQPGKSKEASPTLPLILPEVS